jgi:hypothetical protein
MDENLLAEARQAQERLIDAERDADVFRAEFYRAVRRLHLHGASLRELAASLGLSHQRVHQIVEEAGGSRRWLRTKTADPPRQTSRRGADLLACTFCGKNQNQVRKLIAGPYVYICDGCTGLARNAIARGQKGQAVRTALGPISAVPEDEPRLQCSFCGKNREQAPGLAVAPMVTTGKGNAAAAICSECLDLCDEIVAEDLSEA